MPAINGATVDPEDGDLATLSLSGPLPQDLWTSREYILTVTNVVPPGSLWEGTGLYPPVERQFYIYRQQ
jgi:hypothetical protein